MPRIPIIQSRIRPGRLRLPRNIPVAGPDVFGVRGFQQLAAFGGRLSQIALRLQEQEDDLEVAELQGEYDGRVRQIALRVSEHPEFREQPALFSRDVTQAATEILQKSKRGPVKEALQGYISRRLPSQIVQVEANALRMWHADQAARLNAEMEDLTRQMAGAPSAEDKQELLTFGLDLITRAQGRGHITAAKAQQLRSALPEKAAQVEALADMRLDPGATGDALRDGGYPGLDPKVRESLIRQAGAEEATRDRLERQELQRLRKEEKVKFYRKLKGETLTAAEILASPHLEAGDMDFFMRSLEKTDDPKTDPSTLIAITDLLHAETSTRTAEIRNAEQALEMSKQAYVTDNTLAKTDAINTINQANKIIAGEDPEDNQWFKLSKSFLKAKFGWQGGVVGKFLFPEGEKAYFELMSQLMEEIEEQPETLVGKAIWERAQQLAEAQATSFWANQADRPAVPVSDQLPNPLDYTPGSVLQSPRTGKVWTNSGDGKKWTEVQQGR